MKIIPLHIPCKRLILAMSLGDFRTKARLPRGIFVGDLCRQVVPFKLWKVFNIPDIVMVIRALLSTDNRSVECLCHELCNLPVGELNPAFFVEGFFVSAEFDPPGVGGRVFGGEEDSVDAAEPG